MDLARNLRHEPVARLNPTPPWGIQRTQTVADAVQVMRQRRVGCILVCEGRQIVGIFTERDLVRRILAAGQPLSLPITECMTPEPVTVQPRDPISVAIKRMQKGGYRHLPVVVDGRPTGILSVKRVISYLVSHFPGTVYNLPPRPNGVPPKREGA
jgi:signal-transduction protein with cAMP-binding, CBS, and nucleotidyltransferase domain